MSRHSTKLIRPNLKVHLLNTHFGPIVGFALITFLFGLGDAVMSYFTPVYIEARVHNTFIMGLIMSSSSIVGIVTDLVLGAFTKNKRFHFFLKWAIIGGILFPAVYLLLPPYFPVFLMGMVIWGMYFELNLFSRNHFIHEQTARAVHDLGWGVIQAFVAVAYLIGPIVAGYLLDRGDRLPLLAALGIFAAAGLAYLVFTRSLKTRAQPVAAVPLSGGAIGHELKVWMVLLPALWPILLFLCVMTLLDSTMWSIGAILSDKLSQSHEWGGFLISLYMLPSLFVGLLAHKLGQPFGKKRAAFATALIGGLVLMVAGLTENISAFLLLIFATSVFTSMAWPEILAVFEDYVDRLGQNSSDLVGLENTITSIAFVIGPILSGFLATLVGEQAAFGVVGLILVLVCLICLVVVPRKVHLPQITLSQVD